MTKINHFAYEYDFLSNFYLDTVLMNGVAYASIEHAYQASKTVEPNWIFSLEANPNLSPAQAKKIGRKLKLRPDWLSIRDSVMNDLVTQKFSQNEDLKNKLLATGDAVLEEGNYWHDVYWGVCYGGSPDGFEGRKCRQGPHDPAGDNKLGQLLMVVRESLKNKP